MKHWKWIAAGVFAFSVAAIAAQQVLYKASGTSQYVLKKDANGFRQSERNIQDYRLMVRYMNGNEYLYLVDSKLNRRYSLDSDGVFGNLSWSVRTGAQLEKSLWSKKEVSTLIDYDDNYGLVVSGLEQCCGAMTGYRIYDVTNGYLIISFNSFNFNPVVTHPFVLDVPNSKIPQRFIGVISGDSTRDQDFIDPVAGMVSTLLVKYAAKDKFFQRLQIDMKTEEGYSPGVMSVTLEKNPAIPDSGKIEIIDDIATLWNIDAGTDPNAIQGVQLKIVLNGGADDKTVIIPVIQDRLSLDQATVPEGVSLRVAN